jgi:hypothetical protein
MLVIAVIPSVESWFDPYLARSCAVSLNAIAAHLTRSAGP